MVQTSAMQSKARINPVVWGVGALALHPFLFASASIARPYASNLPGVYFTDGLAALGAALAAALLLLLAFGVVFRSLGAKAAVLASATLVAGLFYGEIVDAVNHYAGAGLSPVSALPIMLAALAAVFVAVALPRVDLTPANAILNGIAFSIVIVPAWQIASHSWQAGGTSLPAAVAFDEASSAARVSAVGDPTATKAAPRQIFYLIFDRYGSQSVLADYYRFDNSDLAGFLEEKILRRFEQPRQLSKDGALARFDVPYGLSRFSGGRPAKQRRGLASTLRWAQRPPRGALPEIPWIQFHPDRQLVGADPIQPLRRRESQLRVLRIQLLVPSRDDCRAGPRRGGAGQRTCQAAAMGPRPVPASAAPDREGQGDRDAE
ncbi:hypothetical protein ACF1BQ_037105 [Bradyrhizobium sp. RDT10]